MNRRLRLFAAAGVMGATALVIRADVDLPEGPGKELLEDNCAECHGLQKIVDKAWTKEKWRAVVKDMVSRGATMKPEEIDTLVDYLATYFGPDNKNP